MTIPAYPAFRFLISVDKQAQAAFTECDLPSIELEVEEIKEGGQNSYPHQLPGRRKAARVSLKNGVGKCALLDWYFTILNGQIKRKSVSIALLDETQQPVMIWDLEGAYPFKWSGSQLRSSDNSIAIQTLELACTEVTISYQGKKVKP
jgi:phage tail-like protein